MATHCTHCRQLVGAHISGVSSECICKEKPTAALCAFAGYPLKPCITLWHIFLLLSVICCVLSSLHDATVHCTEIATTHSFVPASTCRPVAVLVLG